MNAFEIIVGDEQLPTIKTIKLPIAYCYSDEWNPPDFVALSFTPETIARISDLQKIAKDQDVLIEMNFIDFECHDYDTEDDTTIPTVTSFSNKLSVIRIRQDNSLYFFTQNQFESDDQFESESFTLEDIITPK